jgi:hypothetical protein
MPKVKLLVSVDDQDLNRFSEFVEDIKKAGMKVEEKHKDIGVVTGSIDSTKVDSLYNVKGVVHVEEERQVQIPPPDSDIQ